jgi:regulator of replication initiation timing
MYGGILSNTRKSDMHSFKLGSNGEEHHVCRRGYLKICKEKEELLEENIQLKTENTKLKEKLSHQKNKIEAMRIKLN